MAHNDIRWQQRFSNYKKALSQLTRFIDKGNLNELEQQGLIQAFEYTYELAWNLLKDYYEYQGSTDIQGSRDAFRLGIQRGLLHHGDVWMNMIKSRAQTSHTYNEEIAMAIGRAIKENYFALFQELRQRMEGLRTKDNNTRLECELQSV